MTNQGACAEKMNQASERRYEIANNISPVYAANPNVAAVMLGGSTARGHADRFSDVELGVFWEHAPSDDDRLSAADQINADYYRMYPYDPAEEVWSDDFIIRFNQPEAPDQEILVEVAHYTTPFIEATFHEVLHDYNPDLLKQNLISGIVDGKALYNPERIQAWKERTAIYPDGLALAVVKKYAQIDHYWRWEMWLSRGNLIMLQAQFTQVSQQLLHMLLGLNRTYYFGFKWLEVIEQRLRWKPANLTKRLAHTFGAEAEVAALELAVLVEDTYDLIAEHMPEIDVERLRAIFRYKRPQF